jgi:sulfur-carrier protein
MVAINEEYANEDDKIKSGDIVALIPPVSGG